MQSGQLPPQAGSWLPGIGYKTLFVLLKGACATQLCQEQRDPAPVETWLSVKIVKKVHPTDA